MVNFCKIPLLILSVTVLAACGGSKKAASGSSSGSSVTPPDPSAPLTQANLQGTWKAGCTVDTANGGSYQDSLIISGGTYISRSDFSDATDCSAPNLALDINGTFTMGTKSTVVAVATNMTMSSINAGVTGKSAAAIADLNLNQSCGLTGWVLNVRKIVPLSCFGLTAAANAPDIVAITGANLMFGNAGGTALDPNYSFQKQ